MRNSGVGSGYGASSGLAQAAALVSSMSGDLKLTAAIRTGRHGHLVAADASIVIADYGSTRGHDVPGQVTIDQIPLGSRPAHITVAVHEPAPRNHEDDGVASGTAHGRQIDLSGQRRLTIASGNLEGLRCHVAETFHDAA
jgi:hypothetical protein